MRPITPTPDVAQQLVDTEWYFKKYPDALNSGMDAFEHYIKIGAKKGYDPSEYFWTNWYLERNADVAKAGINPLLHFASNGGSEGRAPSPIFDANWYLTHYADVDKCNPLLHYLTIGQFEGRATRLDEYIEAFKASKLPSRNLNDQTILATVERASNLGKQALYQAIVVDGRTFANDQNMTVKGISRWPNGRIVSTEIESKNAFANEPYLLNLKDAVIVPGVASIVPKAGIVINDEIYDESRLFDEVVTKSWADTWVKSGNILFNYSIDVTPIIPEGVHLFKEYEKNYFHFVTELVTKLQLLESDQVVPVEIPLLVSDDLPETVYDLINLVKSPDREILKLKRSVPYLVGDLYYLSDVSKILDRYHETQSADSTFISAHLLRGLAEKVRSAILFQQDERRRRIYLARSGGSRQLINQSDLIDLLFDFDFEITSLEQLKFSTQVKLLASAETVIGPTGAAFTNLIWCTPDTHVIILYPDHPLSNKTFWNIIADAMGLKVEYIDGPLEGDVLGKYGMHDNFSIDVNTVQNALASRNTNKSKKK